MGRGDGESGHADPQLNRIGDQLRRNIQPHSQQHQSVCDHEYHPMYDIEDWECVHCGFVLSTDEPPWINIDPDDPASYLDENQGIPLEAFEDGDGHEQWLQYAEYSDLDLLQIEIHEEAKLLLANGETPQYVLTHFVQRLERELDYAVEDVRAELAVLLEGTDLPASVWQWAMDSLDDE